MNPSLGSLHAMRRRARRRRAASDYLRYDGPERRQTPRRSTSRLRWRLAQLVRRTAG